MFLKWIVSKAKERTRGRTCKLHGESYEDRIRTQSLIATLKQYRWLHFAAQFQSIIKINFTAEPASFQTVETQSPNQFWVISISLPERLRHDVFVSHMLTETHHCSCRVTEWDLVLSWLESGDITEENGDDGMNTVKSCTTVGGHSPLPGSHWLPSCFTSVRALFVAQRCVKTKRNLWTNLHTNARKQICLSWAQSQSASF